MPGCNQTLAGIQKDCSTNMGGIVEVLLANKEDVSTITVTTGEVSAITMVTSKTFKKYEFDRNTGSLVSNYVINRENGVRYVESTLTMVFNKMETAKKTEVEAMAQNDLVAIVKDANGKYWLLGYDEPVNATDGTTGGTGTARGDRNGYTVVLLDTSHGMPYEVDPDIIEDLLPA